MQRPPGKAEIRYRRSKGQRQASTVISGNVEGKVMYYRQHSLQSRQYMEQEETLPPPNSQSQPEVYIAELDNHSELSSSHLSS